MQLKKEPSSYALVIGLMLFVVATSQVLGSITTSTTISNSVTLTSLTLSPLHTSGQYIYNSSGARVTLYAAHFQQGNQGAAITLADIQKVKTMGFNTIRITLYWGDIQTSATDPTYVDPNYFTNHWPSFQVASLDEIVGWCVETNMYIILTLYWSEWHPPPTWSFPGISRVGMGEGIPQMYDYLLGFNYTADKVDATIGVNERTGMAAVWTAVANRYKNIPNVLFETLNEPCLGLTSNTAAQLSLAGTPYKTFNEQMISAMEAGEAGGVSHLKLVQLLLDNKAGWQEVVDPTIALDINKPNQVWTSHTYTPMYGFDPNGAQWAEAFTLKSTELHTLYLAGLLANDYPPGYYSAMTRTQALYVAWRLARMADTIHDVWNKPWMDTEFGKDPATCVSQVACDVWFDISCGVKRDYNITGWTFFCYCSLANYTPGYNINNPTTNSLILPVLTPWMIQP